MGKEIAPVAQILQSIYLLRGVKVMLDVDLADLYEVTTGALNQAVRRNRSRFPEDFMFRLSSAEEGGLKCQLGISNEKAALKSQIVMSKNGRGGRRHRSYALTEQGVAMLSSVLRSERAVQANIAIMRAFVRLRAALESNHELARKFSELQERVGKHDEDIGAVIEAIRQLLEAPAKKIAREIGFHVRETTPRYGTRIKRR